MKTLSVVSAILSTCLIATAVQAKTIEYKDLNLANEKDKAELDRRIDVVAKDICRSQLRTGTRLTIAAQSAYMKDCMAAVRAEAMAKIPVQG